MFIFLLRNVTDTSLIFLKTNEVRSTSQFSYTGNLNSSLYHLVFKHHLPLISNFNPYAAGG